MSEDELRKAIVSIRECITDTKLSLKEIEKNIAIILERLTALQEDHKECSAEREKNSVFIARHGDSIQNLKELQGEVKRHAGIIAIITTICFTIFAAIIRHFLAG